MALVALVSALFLAVSVYSNWPLTERVPLKNGETETTSWPSPAGLAVPAPTETMLASPPLGTTATAMPSSVPVEPTATTVPEGSAALLAANSTPTPMGAPATATAVPTPAAKPAATPVPSPLPSPTPSAPRTYLVKQGDTLYSVAHALGVTVEALIRANSLRDENHIFAGQRLVVPTAQ